jgi:predicted Zn-dependent peptidase
MTRKVSNVLTVSTMYKTTRLLNGVTIATAEMPHMTSVSIGLWVGIGSRYEPAELNGVCHFIEHLLFKGTKKRTAKQMSEAVEGIGGYLNAFTGEEATCFHARACHDHFDDLLDVLMDMLLNSSFNPAEVARERQVIKEEIAMYLDEPHHLVQELLNATIWPDHPLGRPITGTNETLDGLDRNKLLGYLRNNYAAGNTILVATGKLKHHQVIKAASRYTRHFLNRHLSKSAPALDGQNAPRLNLFTKDTEQTQLALGIRTCSRHDVRRYALRLLNTILGENMSSRLFQIIREDRGLAYSIYSTPSFFEDTGDLVISAGLDTDNLSKTLRLIIRELRRLAEISPSAAELRRARDYVLGQIDLGQESTENQMNWIGEQLVGYGRLFSPNEVKRRLRLVTPAQIRTVARDFFKPNRFNLALVSPLKSAKHLAKALSS